MLLIWERPYSGMFRQTGEGKGDGIIRNPNSGSGRRSKAQSSTFAPLYRAQSVRPIPVLYRPELLHSPGCHVQPTLLLLCSTVTWGPRGEGGGGHTENTMEHQTNHNCDCKCIMNWLYINGIQARGVPPRQEWNTGPTNLKRSINGRKNKNKNASLNP